MKSISLFDNSFKSSFSNFRNKSQAGFWDTDKYLFSGNNFIRHADMVTEIQSRIQTKYMMDFNSELFNEKQE